MNAYLVTAAILLFLIGLVHSVLGEYLIFNRMRKGEIRPTHAQPVLRGRHVRIIWASWHIMTFFGWAFALIVLEYAYWPPNAPEYFLDVIQYTLVLSSLLILYATNGRHPGWIGLLLAAILIFLR